MKENDNIKELFSDKLGNFESQVNPEMWTKISSQLGGTGTTAVGGLSVLSKAIIGVAAITVITAATILVLNTKKEVKETILPIVITQDSTEDVKLPDTVIEETGLDLTVPAQKAPPKIILAPITQTERMVPEFISEIPQEQNFRSDVPLNKETDRPESVKKGGVQTEKDERAKQPEQIKKEEVITNLEGDSNEGTAFTLGVLPNIFTPNGDGKNDYLFIESSGLEDFTFVVLNSNQQMVYESSDVDFKWDGTTLQGVMIEDGVYSYYFIARDKFGNAVKRFMKLSVYR